MFEFCWQPIDTAPKNEEEVLLYCPKNGPYVGCWMNAERANRKGNYSELYNFEKLCFEEIYSKFYDYHEPRFEPKLIYYHGCGRCCEDWEIPEPSHWMRLPKKFKEVCE